MKTRLTYFTFVVAFLLTTPTLAKIWRVNNNPGTQADFNTLLAAHNAASSGDTLHIEGSSINYDADFKCEKPLVIIGPGFFLGENKDVQAITYPATVNLLRLASGSSGSSVMGMTFSQVWIEVSNVVFIRNKVNSTIYLNMTNPNSNILLGQNYLANLSQFNTSSLTGLLVINNVVEGSITMPVSFTALFQNNIFGNNVNVHNSNFTNNIMTGGTFTPNNNIYSHNLGNGTQFGSANGNMSDINMGDIFVGASGNSTDGKWKLKESSPAKGAGVNETDAGIFAGVNPYILSGIPAVPSIYMFSLPPTGNTNDPFNVTIKVRSNN